MGTPKELLDVFILAAKNLATGCSANNQIMPQCLRAKSSKVSPGYSNVSVTHDDVAAQRLQNVYVPRSRLFNMSYSVSAVLRAVLAATGVTCFSSYVHVIPLNAYQTRSLYIFFTCGFPHHAVKPETALTPKRIPFLPENQSLLQRLLF